MNDKARKQARRAELESELLSVWEDERSLFKFTDWLYYESKQEFGWRDDAIELIALYGE